MKINKTISTVLLGLLFMSSYAKINNDSLLFLKLLRTAKADTFKVTRNDDGSLIYKPKGKALPLFFDTCVFKGGEWKFVCDKSHLGFSSITSSPKKWIDFTKYGKNLKVRMVSSFSHEGKKIVVLEVNQDADSIRKIFFDVDKGTSVEFAINNTRRIIYS